MLNIDDISLLVEEVYQKARISADAKAQASLDAEAARSFQEVAETSRNEWAAAHTNLADAVTAVNKALAELVEQDNAGTNPITVKKSMPSVSPAKPAVLKR